MSELSEALRAARQPGDLREALDAATGRGRVPIPVEDLIPAFEVAAEHARDAEQKAKLRAVVAALRALGRDFAVEVTAAVIVRQMGL